MARLWMSISIGILAAATVAGADPDPFSRLEKVLPPGWSMLTTASELVFRHDRPCYVAGRRHDRAPAVEARAPGPPGGGPLITIELRYRLEPRWTAGQIAAARATNVQVAAELRALAARYHIDAIHKANSQPLPASADERTRLDGYNAARAPVAARLVKLPRCSFGDTSVFDGDDTYAQLSLDIDPPEVITQAHQIIELVKQHCG